MLAGKKDSLVAAVGGAPLAPAALRPLIKREQEEEQPEDPVAALLLLAGLADDGGPASVKPRSARPASAHRSRSGNSSGGSADTQGELPGGGGDGDGGAHPLRRAQRARRASAKRRRVEDDDADYRVAEEEVDTEETEDEEMMGAGSGDEAEGGQLALALVNGAAAAAAAVAAADLAAAAFVEANMGGEGEAVGEGEAPPAKRRPSKPAKPPAPLGQRKYVSSQITISILEEEGCFNMTQVDAARHLGFGSSTVLKKVMRRLGIKQWPYRKRTSAKKITCSLEEYMRKYGDPAKVDAVLERVRMELAVYEASPTGSIPLRPELAALRQRLYKLDNKVKHEFKRDIAAENALRQCVQSLVEKTWQELQPSWMSDLARQPPLLQPLPDAPDMAMPLPLTANDLAQGFDCGMGNSFDAAQAVMLAMLMAQGMLPQAALLMPGQHGTLSDLSAATAQQEAAAGGGAPAGQAGEPTPQTQQMQGPAASPEEAAAMVAALAPEPAAAIAAAAVKHEEGVGQEEGQGEEGLPELAAAAAAESLAAAPAAPELTAEEVARVRVAALAPSPAAARA